MDHTSSVERRSPASLIGPLCRFVLPVALAAILAGAGTVAADDSATVLEGNHPDEAAAVVGESAATPSRRLAMGFTIAIRNRAELTRLLADQQDPASSEYHRWLTPEEFTSRFGPAAADLARVARWLTKKGFTVTSADASTREVSFTGSVAQAESAFAVRITAAADGRMYSNTADPAVPASLASLIESVHGLDNLLHSKPFVHRVSRDGGASSPATVVDDTGPSFGPGDIYTFYDEMPLLNGSATLDGGNSGCIALVEDSNLDQPAADTFNSQFGLPPLTSANFSTVLVDRTDPGLIPGDQDETMIDVSFAHAVAPGSGIRLYLGDPKYAKVSSILDAIRAAVTEKHNPCSAISISFGFCGGSKGLYKGEDGLFAQAAAQGQSVFAVTGDSGAAGLALGRNGSCVTGTSPNISELAASPNVTAIGGTEFTPDYVNGDDTGFVSESVWDDTYGSGGGGESRIFKKPAFQKGLIAQDKRRDVPDISFGASPVSPGFFYGGRDDTGAPAVLCCIGGTSVGAPAWAGISQLIAQGKGARPGNLNRGIYQLGAEANGASTGIRDVTRGSNSFNGVKGFSASAGYDKASGWGTVDMDAFVSAYLRL